MLPFKLVYHDRYDLRLFAHVFPSQKFRLILGTLVAVSASRALSH